MNNQNERIIYLQEKASKLPFNPGVYIMKDKNEKIIYVGKSKVLRQRVSQYFADGARHDIKTQKMVLNVCDFEFMLCDNNMEALTLENRLIKLHLPKFNIKLKDSKSYPYIHVTNEEYPKLEIVRKRENDSGRYFGPYQGASTAYTLMKTAQKVFRIASCGKQFPRDIGKARPCLYMQLGQCAAPCTGKITGEEYREIFKNVTAFLRGSFRQVKDTLTVQMETAAENLMFESAAVYRDRISALTRLCEKQKVVASPDAEQDVIALYSDEVCSCITVFYIREGSVVDSGHFIFSAEQIVDAEALTAFLTDLYMKREYIPREILLGFDFDDGECELFSDFLKERAGHKIFVRIPERGDLKALCDMVYGNAKQHAEDYKSESEKDNEILVKLASMLSLEVVPERIEAFDISNMGSENITAGMIVSENCKLKKTDYRVFNIDGNGKPDDYASMREAIGRRLNHTAVMPDLILLDGGKGHVSVIRALLEERGIDIPVFGMVKDDYHKTRALTSDTAEISIAREQAVFQFIYKLQEEVHRFTVSKMSDAKSKSLRTSRLEQIDGIGAAKAKALLAHFKSIAAMSVATHEQFREIRGISEKNADALLAYFLKEKIKNENNNRNSTRN